MGKMRAIKKKVIEKWLKKNGFVVGKVYGKQQGDGSHTFWKHPDGRRTAVRNEVEIQGPEVHEINKQVGHNFFD